MARLLCLLLVLLAALLGPAASSSHLPSCDGEGCSQQVKVAAAGLAEEEADGEGEEEEAPTMESTGVSMMLIGSIAFMMSIFYVTNHSDPDFRNGATMVVSDTISIFSAVLFFQAVQGLLEAYVLEGMSEVQEMGVGFAHMFFWFLVLQLALAILSGSIRCGRTFAYELEDEESTTRKDLEAMHCYDLKLNMKTWAVLLGHITGFATITAFGNLQQMVKDSTFASLFVVFLTMCTLLFLFKMTDCFRTVYSKGDGKVSEEEEQWDEGTEETEDDVMCLAVSFLLVQVFRKLIHGKMPNVEGEDDESMALPNNAEAVGLAGFALIFALCQFADLRKLFGKTHIRAEEQLRIIIGMCFAWCLLFSIDWLIADDVKKAEGMMHGVMVALVTTFISISLIFFFDKLADLSCTGKGVDESLRNLMRAQGILIGFSWERSFDTAVAQLAQEDVAIPRPIVKLMMATVLCLIVVPAWRWFILPSVLEIEEEEEGEGGEEEEKDAFAKVEDSFTPQAKAEKADEQKRKLKELKEKIRISMIDIRECEGKLCNCRRDDTTQKESVHSLEVRNHQLEEAVDRFGHEIRNLETLVDNCVLPQGR